jgi:dihydrofolate reductase
VGGTIIVAVAANGVIGRDNEMPWHLPDDLRHFKALTLGRTLLMGRRTFDSIGRPLPGRRTVVLTRQRNWTHAGVDVIHTLDDARTLLRSGNVVLAGGGELYAELLDEIDTLELTEIHREVDGDARFPDVDPAIWRETARDEQDGFAWVSYRRRGTAG